MAITGVHTLFHTTEPEALRTVLADVLGWSYVDSGGGWLIFKMPPAEMGVHPSGEASHEISLMCDDLDATVRWLRDVELIKALPQRYAYGIDEKDFAVVRSVFHPEASVVGTVHEGAIGPALEECPDATRQTRDDGVADQRV